MQGRSLMTYNSNLLGRTHPEQLADSARRVLRLVADGQVHVDITAEYDLADLAMPSSGSPTVPPTARASPGSHDNRDGLRPALRGTRRHRGRAPGSVISVRWAHAAMKALSPSASGVASWRRARVRKWDARSRRQQSGADPSPGGGRGRPGQWPVRPSWQRSIASAASCWGRRSPACSGPVCGRDFPAVPALDGHRVIIPAFQGS